MLDQFNWRKKQVEFDLLDKRSENDVKHQKIAIDSKLLLSKARSETISSLLKTSSLSVDIPPTSAGESGSEPHKAPQIPPAAGGLSPVAGAIRSRLNTTMTENNKLRKFIDLN
jgi:hypothetical protein